MISKSILSVGKAMELAVSNLSNGWRMNKFG